LGGTLHTQTRAARQSIADIASSANIVSRSGPPPSLRITHQPHHASRNQQRQRLRLHASNLFQCGVLNASRPCCSRDTLARSHNPRASTLRDAGSRLPLHAFLRTAAPTRTATLICSRPICSVRKTPPGPAATAIRALSHALRPSPQVLGSQAARQPGSFAGASRFLATPTRPTSAQGAQSCVVSSAPSRGPHLMLARVA